MNCKDTNLNGARIKSGMLSPLSASVAAVPVKVCVEDPARLKDKPEQTQNRLKTMMEFPLIRQLSRPVAVMEVVEVTVLV